MGQDAEDSKRQATAAALFSGISRGTAEQKGTKDPWPPLSPPPPSPPEPCSSVLALDIDGTGERLAFGSTSGGLWVSEDGGERWTAPDCRLPPVACVRFEL